MRKGTLGMRIFAAVAATLACLFLVGGLLAESRIRDFGREEVARRLAALALLVEDSLRPGLRGELSPGVLRERVGGLRIESGVRVTLVAPDGTVLADNVKDPPLENHGDRPEILEAARSGRGTDARTSASTGWGTLYFARRVDEGGRPLGFVRVAEPLRRAEEEVASIRNALLLGGAGILLVGLAASALIARWIERPLAAMERAAARIAEGDLEGRVRVGGPVEVSRLAGSLNRMADGIRESITAERRARADLESVLSGLVEGVVAVDGAESILFMNAAAARVLGLQAPVAAGGSLWEAVRFPDLEDALRDALRGRPVGGRDAASPAQDGRTLEIAAGPLGGGRGAVALLRDVTEVRRLERIRMDFVANVSHELRTPLAAVSGALETLGDGDLLEEERRRFLEIATRNALRLQALVADLLDLSAIEAEGTGMALETVPADRPLRGAANALADMAARCGVALAVESPAGPALPVAANVRRLEQALVNLVENALKYTPAGGRVTARVLERGGEVAYEVEDTGVGIPAAALPRIFERFYRVDPGRSRRMGGTGLGLAIVKHVARAHRGRVEVRSVEGAGSTFTVLLPRAPA